MTDPQGVRGVVTDIEGTTTPVRFVTGTLFPYAERRLDGFLAAHGEDADVAPLLDEVRRLAPDRPVTETLRGWMRDDAKVAPLKTLQGLIWREGYRRGELRGALYPDVAPALRHWHAAGLVLAVYSSGSIEAQQLLFGHSEAGDLSALFAGFFDTRTGPKREASSYVAIAGALDLPASALLFLSDVEAELDAAAGAGFRVRQIVRQADGTVAGHHPVSADFASVTHAP